MAFRHFKYLIFLVWAQVSFGSPAISVNDTAYINQLLRQGRALHYDHPDSALFLYHLIIEDYRSREIQVTSDLKALEQSYLGTVIRAQNYAGNIYYYDDEFSRADYYYQSSLDLARKAGFKEFTANSLYDVGYIRYVTNDYTTAARMFTESYDLFTESENRQGMFDAIQACALAERHLGNLDDAEACYQKALELAVALGDSVQVADVRMNNGILLCEQGNLEQGTRYFEEALRYYETHGEDEAVSLALLNIGVVMKMLGEYEKAESYIKRSADISELLQQKSQLVIRYYNLADLFMEMGKLETAYSYCLKTMAVADEIGTRPFVTECNLLLGKYYHLKKDYEKAGPYFKVSLDSAKSSNDKPLIANILLWSSRNSLKGGRSANAVSQASEAVKMADDVHLLMVCKEASQVLSEAYEKSGDLKASLTWYKKYQVYNDSLNYFNQHKEISRIEAKYNFDKKERENDLLRNQASLQEQKLRNRNTVTMALVTGFALSLVIIILLIRRSRDAKLLFHQEQMLNLKHLEELEIELDGKNRELTSKMMFLNQKNDLISRLMKRLQEIRDSSDHSSEEIISIVNELKSDAPQSNWKEFETQFVQVHPDFYQRLYEKHSDLTSYEQRICAFLRMNLNTKEISSITGRSAKSIEVTRSRIRTKIALHRNENLSSYLAAI